MLTSVTFFLLLCYSAVLCYPHGVFWTIVDKRVTIGHDLNLYCNESSLAALNCCTKHSTRRWFGGPNRELLYRNGISSYPSKYTSRLEDGGFYLTIHNVEEKDLNVSYACSVAIYEYTHILLPLPPYETVQVVPETSTKLSMSTEPSISGSTTIGLEKANTDEYIDKLTNTVIIITTFLVLFIVVAIVGYRRRIRKLLMGICTWKLIRNQTKTENSDQKSLEEGKLIGNQTKTENSDQKSLEEGKLIEDQIEHSDQKSLEEGKLIEDQIEHSDQKSLEEEYLIEAVTTTGNTDQNNFIEPVSVDTEQNSTTGTTEIRLDDGTISRIQCENGQAITTDKRPQYPKYGHLGLEEIFLKQKAQPESYLSLDKQVCRKMK